MRAQSLFYPSILMLFIQDSDYSMLLNQKHNNGHKIIEISVKKNFENLSSFITRDYLKYVNRSTQLIISWVLT